VYPYCILLLLSPGSVPNTVRMIKPDGTPVGFLPTTASGSVRLPPGHVLQIPNRGPYPVPMESGRGMSDLQSFVRSVRPQQFFQADGSSQPGINQPGQHHFSPGHKRPGYGAGEQPFGATQFAVPADSVAKSNHRPESAVEQSTGFLDASALERGMLA
jgi:hypothetical protein